MSDKKPKKSVIATIAPVKEKATPKNTKGTIAKCTCVSEYQDGLYGKGMKAKNPTSLVDLNVQYAGNNRNNPLKIISNKQAEKKKKISLNVFLPLPDKMLICLVDLNFIGSKTRLIMRR